MSLTEVNRGNNMAVIKNHYNGDVFGYQVHTCDGHVRHDPMNPRIETFPTKVEADDYIGKELVKPEKAKPKKKAKKKT